MAARTAASPSPAPAVGSAEVVLIRHGETEWSLSGRHTGTTDIPLTENGRRAAGRLESHLGAIPFALVLCSPLHRAIETCEQAGFGDVMQIEPRLAEWDYGAYEGLTHAEIQQRQPDWLVFRDGCPGGESPEQVGQRVDAVLETIRTVEGPVALFAHGHVLRVLAARWIGLPPSGGASLLLDTTTFSVLSHYRGVPALRTWNASLGQP